MSQFKFKKDSFRNARNSYSRMLSIYCVSCNKEILTYQKDGSGNLKRLYLDRIFSPINLVDLQKKDINQINNLTCPYCNKLLGVPYIYPKENRKAFRLYQDAIAKKIIKD